MDSDIDDWWREAGIHIKIHIDMQVERDTSTAGYWGSSLDRSHLVALWYLIDWVDGKLDRQMYDVAHAPPPR